MSDTLVATFQSQLSVVMETILKSAMMEITRLVEESFLEEVARGKQEVELLLRRLQFSEIKLKEREKSLQCTDCGRSTAAGERITDKATETHTGEDSLCFRLSLREQSEKRPQVSEVWRSTENLSSYRTTETHSDKEESVNVPENTGRHESTSKTEVQHPQCVAAPITKTQEVFSNPRPRESLCKSPVMAFPPIKDTDLSHSGCAQNASEQASTQSPSDGTVKSEYHHDPIAIKEEEEMFPVWDCGDDFTPAEMDQNLAGSWNRDKTQVDTFPNLTALNMPDPSLHFMSYSLSCSTEVSHGIKAEPSESVTSRLIHLASAPGPEGAGSFDRNKNRHSFVPENHPEICLGEKRPQIEHSDLIPIEKPHWQKSFFQVVQQTNKPLKCPQCAKTFAQDFELIAHQKQHTKERPHVCPYCGKAFTRFNNFKQHQNIHTREKLFNCTQCGMRFKRSTHLRVHLMRHSRVGKSCLCRQCGKTFVSVQQLKGHLLKVHGTQMN